MQLFYNLCFLGAYLGWPLDIYGSKLSFYCNFFFYQISCAKISSAYKPLLGLKDSVIIWYLKILRHRLKWSYQGKLLKNPLFLALCFLKILPWSIYIHGPKISYNRNIFILQYCMKKYRVWHEPYNGKVSISSMFYVQLLCAQILKV